MVGVSGITCITRPVDLDPLRPRLGLLLLATDLTTEGDFARLVHPDAACLHGARIAYSNPTTPQNLRAIGPRVSEGVSLLVPGVALNAICFSCTSASVLIGETAIAAAVAVSRPGVPVVTPIGAARRALAALGASRIAILTPYLPETTSPVAAHFSEAGFDVVATTCLGMEDDREMARVHTAAIIEAARSADRPGAEALFISCTALPALGVIARIEMALGKPVVTSNQASIWQMRQIAGLRGPVAGYGSLFEPRYEAGTA